MSFDAFAIRGFREPKDTYRGLLDPWLFGASRKSYLDLMWDLSSEVMKIESGDEADDRLRYAECHAHEIGIAKRCKIGQAVYPPTHPLE
jgi:hypothetical protein